jgi:hypothetical protein
MILIISYTFSKQNLIIIISITIKFSLQARVIIHMVPIWQYGELISESSIRSYIPLSTCLVAYHLTTLVLNMLSATSKVLFYMLPCENCDTGV